MDSPLWVYLLGLAGMGIYGTRILIQWYMSEKSHKVESPGVYWVLSSIGAIIIYLYGWLRKDFSIIFGESVGYYIYMWNISILGLYKKIPRPLIVLQAIFPLIVLGLIVKDFPSFVNVFLRNEYVPRNLLLFGVLGQLTYELRSVYQLVYSYRRGASFLPLGHWILAIIGSSMIIAYGLIRHDWVLAIGQFSIVFSIRNLMICLAAPKWTARLTKLLMVRPACCRFNEQTAANNLFQHKNQDPDIQDAVLEEFDGMVRTLESHDIPVVVVEDTKEPETPDAIFPNNWFSTHGDGSLVLYPMFAPNRREERKPEVMKVIREEAGTRRVVDLTGWEARGKFLESTGSMVLDRASRIAYACRSPRTSEIVLDEFCRKMGYKSVLFDAVDRNGNPIYHTNVMMSVGDGFAVVCRDVIISPEELAMVERNLTTSGKEIIDVSYDQMRHFACNILQVKNKAGERFIVMSDTARNSLDEEQLSALNEKGSILAVHIPHIEEIGGGSARCMMAEIIYHLP